MLGLVRPYLHDQTDQQQYRSRILATISLRFLGIILRVLRLEVSIYNVYITNQFQATLLKKEGEGVKSISRGDCEYQGGKLLRLCPNYVQEFCLCTVSHLARAEARIGPTISSPLN